MHVLKGWSFPYSVYNYHGLAGGDCASSDESLFLVDWAEVANRLAMVLAVVVPVDPEGKLPDQLLRAFQGLCIVIEAQYVFEGGEKPLHYGNIHRLICSS